MPIWLNVLITNGNTNAGHDHLLAANVWTGVAITAQIVCSNLFLCWITYEVDYLNSNLVNKEEKKNSEMPLGLGQSSAISLMLPRQLVLVQVNVLTLSLSLSRSHFSGKN